MVPRQIMQIFEGFGCMVPSTNLIHSHKCIQITERWNAHAFVLFWYDNLWILHRQPFLSQAGLFEEDDSMAYARASSRSSMRCFLSMTMTRTGK